MQTEIDQVKVLLVGGGGREHALGWKIAQSPLLSKLYLAPGSPGLNPLGEALSISADDVDAIVAAAVEISVDLVVVGPEAPLAAGLADRLADAGIACFGPSAAATRLESSKAFMKDVCAACGAPTAAYETFEEAAAAKSFLRTLPSPYVVKADGLAAGKGVVIARTLDDADAAVDDMFAGRFGAAGARIVIEEFMEGEEASFFAICDGERVAPLIGAQDHKRAFDGDRGPNTGGMGAYSPTPAFTEAVRDRAMREIVEPIVKEMRRRDAPFVGVVYAGLMIKDGAPRLIEINARFGDPECQVLMRLLRSDLLPVLAEAAAGRLEKTALDWRDEAAAVVVMAADGYPGAYDKGASLDGLEDAETVDGVTVFHAGVAERSGRLVADGGRVLNVTATAPSLEQAVRRAYDGVSRISFPGGFYRRDIAWRALEGEK